ncbi:hypothetical protein SAMN05444392_101247 [Seinonella peptonophila]|uniref:Uncharacterized protein n=1 Tax=Seinonella peptonophila TaxID=112248 RepID=A0A1M4T0U2_9BACL|nr:hypothetical protein [Seinonella peptonophila]SHE38046.1 hypothetical protein SAMN05444392_101247 [Seinonella peptonophila]
MKSRLKSELQMIPKSIQKDLAMEIMTELIADKGREIYRIKGQMDEYINEIKELEGEKERLKRERIQMHFGDEKIIFKIITRYSKELRRKFQGDF